MPPTAPAGLIPSLLAQLSRAIGRQSARTEFRWMTQTLECHPPDIPPSAKSIEEMLIRRVAGEPLQYILGSQPFGLLDLAVRSPVLIPRMETEDWTLRLANSLLPSDAPRTTHLKILDLCTGTGCIPLLICRLLPPGTVHATGIDVSPAAVNLAKENAVLTGFSRHEDEPDPGNQNENGGHRPQRSPFTDNDNTGKHISNTFTALVADLMHPSFVTQARLQPPYDLITSNPPYIPKAQYDTLHASVKDHEDMRALLGDLPDATLSLNGVQVPASDRAKGLTFYHRIAMLVRQYSLLRRDGTLALEVGAGQAADVAAIVEHKAGLEKIDIWQDPRGKDRVVVARNA